MNNNDDPIQENSPLRLGVNRLIEDDEYRTYSDDLHDCSTDLSENGSIKEEKAHADFARMRREARYNTTTFKSTINEFSNKGRKANNAAAIIVFIIFIVISAISSIMEMASDMIYNSSSNIDYDYGEYEREVENRKNIFEDSKNNILINSTILADRIILDIENSNIDTFNNVKIQTVFYDEQNLPVYICEEYINTLFALGRYVCEITDVPTEYEGFNFLITQTYVTDSENINYTDLELMAGRNEDDDFEITITNYSARTIGSVEVMAVYYKDGNIVEIASGNIYDLKQSYTKHDTIYNFMEPEAYDDVKFHINDVYISE